MNLTLCKTIMVHTSSLTNRLRMLQTRQDISFSLSRGSVQIVHTVYHLDYQLNCHIKSCIYSPHSMSLRLPVKRTLWQTDLSCCKHAKISTVVCQGHFMIVLTRLYHTTMNLTLCKTIMVHKSSLTDSECCKFAKTSYSVCQEDQYK